ncbi:MAG: PPOX class F420-dependent oxidoreductase [Anaerolineales bacterium]
MDERLKQFEGKSFLNLETFRKNGNGVKTPVWFTQDGETIYVRTVAGSGKVKRARNNGTSRIVPCEANGKVTGEWVAAEAVEVTDEQTAELVRRLLERKYGAVQVKSFAALTAIRREKYTVLRIRLLPR